MPLKVVHISKTLIPKDGAAKELWNNVIGPKWIQIAEKRGEKLLSELMSGPSNKRVVDNISNLDQTDFQGTST